MIAKLIIIALAILTALFIVNTIWAEDYSNEEIADAIYLAEGGAQTNHPYGILKKYKNTSPRQACINTIRNQRIRHSKHSCGKDFLTCLRDRYCPISCDTDNGTNRFWLRNVKFFLERGKSCS